MYYETITYIFLFCFVYLFVKIELKLIFLYIILIYFEYIPWSLPIQNPSSVPVQQGRTNSLSTLPSDLGSPNLWKTYYLF